MQTVLLSTGDLGPRQALMRIVASGPTDIWQDGRRLTALLKDYSPHSRRKIFALKLVQEEQLVADLQKMQGQLPLEALLSRLTRQLQERTGLAENLARWSLESWACALGYLEDDGADPLASETVANLGTPSTVRPPVIAAPVDPYQRLLTSAQKTLDQALRLEDAEQALSSAEQVLRMVQDVLQQAVRHAGLQALLIQTRSEIVRRALTVAKSSCAQGQLDRATELWQRVLVLDPNHPEARTELQVLATEYDTGLRESKELWNYCKLSSAINRLEKLLPRFGYREGLHMLLAERRASLQEIQAIMQEIPELKKAGKLERLRQHYDRLETLAPVPGLTESRLALQKQVSQAEPWITTAQAALAEARYGDAAQQARLILSRIVDHAAAQEIVAQAELAQVQLQNQQQELQSALRTNNLSASEACWEKLSPAEQQLPVLLLPFASLQALRGNKARYRQQFVAFGVGLAIWLLAGWLTGRVAAGDNDFADKFHWSRAATISGIILIVQSLLAAFGIGSLAALVQKKSEYRSLVVLLIASTAQILVLAIWLNSTAKYAAWATDGAQTFVSGTLIGLWLAVAITLLLADRTKPWFLSLLGTTVGLCLLLACDSLPGNYRGEARQLLVSSSLWMTSLVLLGWVTNLWHFCLLPWAIGLLCVLLPAISIPGWEFLRYLATGSFLTMALLPLIVKRLHPGQILGVWLMAMALSALLAGLSGISSKPEITLLMGLWCWAWLPRLSVAR